MKLRVLPIVIALFTTGIVLFGGWFMYHSYAMENPLAQLVDRSSGVEQVDSSFSKQTVNVTLKLKNGASLREIYQKIAGSGLVGDRKVQLNVVSNSSPAIDKWWSAALFDIAQAMETRHYSDIPKILGSRSGQLPGLTAATEMDDQNVYIRLTQGDKSKYIILPREAATMGVWPNE
jgi:hypothetical protein